MNAIHTLARPFSSLGLRADLQRLVLSGLCLVMAACGGQADAPPPPETLPIVLTQPADESVVVGEVADFSVTATGAAPLAYQWSSSVDGITFTTIGGATSPDYGTGPTVLSQSGSFFRVLVSNSLGSVTSSAARLTVTPAPVAPAITVQPASQTVTAPATATFSVTATGTAPAYEWQVSVDDGVVFTVVPGGPNAPTLAVSNTSAAQDNWLYRVRVSNSAGSVVSSAARLRVNVAPAAPTFTTQPASQSVVVGAGVSFTVAVAGSPQPSIQWRINGASLVDGAQASGACMGAGVSGATSTTLTLTTVPIGCSGAVFSAVASNGVNPDATSSNATLTVNAAAMAPSIVQQPNDVSVVVGLTAIFTAAAAGVPSPTVQWQQSTDAGVTWANITAATTASYTTPATVLTDSGKRFRAVFTNGSGSATSNGGTLTVTASTPSAMFTTPEDVAVDAAGNFYIADTGNHRINKITSTGVFSTLAGSAGNAGTADGTGSAARFNVPRGLAVDSAGNVYVADTFNETIRKITPAGVVSTLAGLAGIGGSVDGTGSAARFSAPYSVAVDAAGTLYVADTSNQTIRRITPAGVVTTLAGLAGSAGFVDGTGNAARFTNPRGVAVDTAGNIYVADSGTQTIRRITPAGTVSTLAGLAPVVGSADGTGSAARFADPRGIAVDAADNVYIGDTGNRTVRKITPAGVVTTLAGLANNAGNVDGTGSAARFASPRGTAVDAAGNVYVADFNNESIRKITPAGVVTTFAQ
ncbi:MAG: SMP-30/gluconolactonase/LRE family protein [Caldimonas sp.]